MVAVFIPENEDTASLSEVLQVLKKQNPEWNPRNIMVDFSLAEIAAIEECFPSKRVECMLGLTDCIGNADFHLFLETHVHVCDFHREKAWSEWL